MQETNREEEPNGGTRTGVPQMHRRTRWMSNRGGIERTSNNEALVEYQVLQHCRE